MVCRAITSSKAAPLFLSVMIVVPEWVGLATSLTHHATYLTNDAGNDPVILPAVRDEFHVKSGFCVPIVDGSKDVIAFLEVHNKKSGWALYPTGLRH